MQIKGTTMLQSSKLIIQSCSHLHRRLHPPPPPLRSHTTTQTPSLKTRELSRRELAIFANSSLLLTASQTILPGISRGAPEEEEIGEQPSIKDVPSCIDSSKTPTKHAFLDISIDGDPVGRIVVGLDVDSAPFGVSRFGELVSGRAGISYRRKEFTKIMPNYVQHGGVRSYGVDAELAKSTGRDLKNDSLKQEWERARSSCPGPRNVQGSVSIIVRDPSKPPPKAKLVARGGKLVMDEEEVGVEPNGTEFVICTKDCPELDDSALVIGRVLQGMEVLQRIGQVKTVQENTSSPYFRVAKLIGDKRAVVAERGFNRPYSKILVTNCGLLD